MSEKGTGGRVRIEIDAQTAAALNILTERYKISREEAIWLSFLNFAKHFDKKLYEEGREMASAKVCKLLEADES